MPSMPLELLAQGRPEQVQPGRAAGQGRAQPTQPPPDQGQQDSDSTTDIATPRCLPPARPHHQCMHAASSSQRTVLRGLPQGLAPVLHPDPCAPLRLHARRGRDTRRRGACSSAVCS